MTPEEYSAADDEPEPRIMTWTDEEIEAMTLDQLGVAQRLNAVEVELALLEEDRRRKWWPWQW
jgi:hypothetical protein